MLLLDNQSYHSTLNSKRVIQNIPMIFSNRRVISNMIKEINLKLSFKKAEDIDLFQKQILYYN
jgi:hypothetical protein